MPMIECYGRMVNPPASYYDVSGSNLDPQTGYPYWRFCDSPQYRMQMLKLYFKIR
jgi:hypothetical protein